MRSVRAMRADRAGLRELSGRCSSGVHDCSRFDDKRPHHRVRGLLLWRDDRTIRRQGSSERDARGLCVLDVESIDRLDMQVRFSAVAGVPTPTDLFADLNVLPHPNPRAAVLKVAERDYTADASDHDVIAGERKPARADTEVLRERVTDRRYAATRVVIKLNVMRSYDGSCDR